MSEVSAQLLIALDSANVQGQHSPIDLLPLSSAIAGATSTEQQ